MKGDEKESELFRQLRRKMSVFKNKNITGQICFEINYIRGNLNKYYLTIRAEEPNKLLV